MARAHRDPVDIAAADLELDTPIYEGWEASIVVKGRPRMVAMCREHGDAVQLMALIERGRAFDTLLDAAVEAFGMIGQQGCFPHLGTERTEQLLLLLLKHERGVKAHKRVWTIDIPEHLLTAVRAAGGQTRSEWEAARAGGTVR